MSRGEIKQSLDADIITSVALTYKDSGVNYSLMDPFKNACLKAGGNTSNLIEFPQFYLTDINEGLGSLNKLADFVFDTTGRDFYFQVGWGNASSILNDLASLGATPLTLKLFIAVGSEDWFGNSKRYQSLIRGFKEAAKYSGASWNGGETQTLVGLINKKSAVFGGSATGIIKPKSHLLGEEEIEAGDRIIILGSSGVHCNGITLIRKIFTKNPEICIEALKNKIIIYSPLVKKILDSGIKIHYASHITGHGWRKIMRSRKKFSYIIEKVPKPQTIFEKIQKKTGMSNRQMYGDYNMGAGFVLFASSKSFPKILELAKKGGVLALDAGYVAKGPRKVIIKPLGIQFESDSLKIR